VIVRPLLYSSMPQYIFRPSGGIPNPQNPSERIGDEAIFGLRTTIEAGIPETHGVPVVSCGQDNSQAFIRATVALARTSLDDAADQARFICLKWNLWSCGRCGVEPAGAGSRCDDVRRDRHADSAGARRGHSTRNHRQGRVPFLLARIKALTGGRSVTTDMVLVKHNAEAGAGLALVLARAGRGAGDA
jgi:pseudouridylate synthase